jgi:hypothetical protein
MADRYILLVEGNDDEHVLYHLLKHHRVPDLFKIKNKGGDTELLNSLEVELLASDLERLGIVLDADTDLAARWQTLRSTLSSSGYDVPGTPDPDGTIIQQPGLPKIGIWIMPDNTLPGMLENYVAFLVPPGDQLWSYAEDCVERIPEQRFPAAHRPKAHIHTWLAWQEEPGTPMGLAITKRYLDAEAPHAHQLMDWIRKLFEI